jgi:hypothetical protein
MLNPGDRLPPERILANHPTFDSPSTRLDSPLNFGVITSASSANEARANFVGQRRIQFFMRLEF